MRSGQAPMQTPQRRQRVGFGFGVPFSSSSSVPKGHSSVQRLHWVQRCRKNSGKDSSPTRGCTALPCAVSCTHWIALSAAPAASCSAEAVSIGSRTVPAA